MLHGWSNSTNITRVAGPGFAVGIMMACRIQVVGIDFILLNLHQVVEVIVLRLLFIPEVDSDAIRVDSVDIDVVVNASRRLNFPRFLHARNQLVLLILELLLGRVAGTPCYSALPP